MDEQATVETKPKPSWVVRILNKSKCSGCHDDFYNWRSNCDGKSWCWSMRKGFARLKGRPSCYH